MNPYKVLDELEEDYKSNIVSHSNDNDKVYTEEEHFKLLIKQINTFRGILDNASYEIIGQTFKGETVKIDGTECLRSEIEDVYLIQPLSYISNTDLDDLMGAITQAYNKGALKNKCTLVLPYDIRVVKAIIKNKGE